MRGLHRCAAVAATVLVAGAAAPGLRVQGVAYTIRQTTHRALPVAGISDTGYTARVVWAGSRGRMDVLSGAQRPLFSEGDYVLFDSTDYIVVHPAAKTYSTSPDLSGLSRSPNVDQMSDAMKVSDVKMTVDTLERGVIVNGFRATHFRTQTSFTITIDMSAFGAPADATPPATSTQAVTDIWYADSVAALPNPFASNARMIPVMLAPMKELFERMRSLSLALPTQRLAVRTTSSTLANGGSQIANADNVMDITDVSHTDVDVARLVLPAGYTLAPLPGAEVFGAPKPLSPEALAKWRALPKG